jgi:hypothetical protein
VKHLSGVPHWCRLLALPANIRLGSKGVLGTNTYYEHFKIPFVKKFYNNFITFCPGLRVLKLSFSSLTVEQK